MRWKLGSQIFAGFALVLTLLGGVAFAGYWSLRATAANFDNTVNKTQPVLMALQQIRLHATAVVLSAVMSKAPSSPPDEPATRLLTAVSTYLRLVEKFFPEERAAASQVQALALDLLQNIGQPGDPSAAIDTKKAYLALAALSTAVERAAQDEEEEFEQAQASIESETDKYWHMLLSASVLSALATIVGGMLLARSIAQPVTALRNAALKLGQGDLETRVKVFASNEVADLADCFNQMADNLAATLVSRDYVSSVVESLSEGVLVIDEAGTIEQCNAAGLRMFAAQLPSELQGRKLQDLLVSDERFPVMMEKFEQGKGFECSLRCLPDRLTEVCISASRARIGQRKMARVLLVQDITERKKNEQHLDFLASYDLLTGLPNRRLFTDHLKNALGRLPWNKKQLGLLFCDLDRFKFVNDSLGHEVGDALLQQVAQRLREALRPGDIVGRWAGDEFVILLGEVTHIDHVQSIASKLVDLLATPIPIGANELTVTVSIGFTCAPTDGIEVDGLIKNADLAMYIAKSSGKNQCCRYLPAMRERTELRVQLEQVFRDTLHHKGQLCVYYQAQQSLDGTLIGFEALARWQHPEFGLLAPAQFLPAAADAGLMADLDASVLRTACVDLRHLHQLGWPHLRVAVNLSNQTFGQADVANVLARVVDEVGLPHTAIELELTEEVVMNNLHIATLAMNQLRAMGFSLSIDDFGTGYSSLAQIKHCPISLLKIDRSFITDLNHDPGDQAITAAIIALAHKLNIKVLAEGVENSAQLAILRQNTCDAIQGYLLSRPLPAAELPDWIAAHRPL